MNAWLRRVLAGWALGAMVAGLAACGGGESGGSGVDGGDEAGAGGSGASGGAGGSSAAGGSGGTAGNAGVAGSGGSAGEGGSAGAGGASGSAGASGGGGSGGTAGAGGSSGSGGSGGSAGAPTSGCTVPVSPPDVSRPDRVVGTGTPESCTESALRTAVAAGGTITFDCGPALHVITLTATLDVTRETTLDGGGRVVLDGGGQVRLLRFHDPDYRRSRRTLTLSRLELRNGRAPASDFTPQNPSAPRCAWGYKDGAGGALYVRNGVVRVFDVTFRDNRAASPGPDVGGGAIYALGSLEITVVGSRFLGNEGSNAGAVGLLQSDGAFYDTVFEGNRATGTGQNYVERGCPNFNHDEQGGAGGNGGAIACDGESEDRLTFCGVVFRNNEANELGGAVFRTPNGQRRDTVFDRVTAQGNRAGKGGGALYISNSRLRIADSTFTENVVVDGTGGGVRTELGTEADFVNVTFHANSSVAGLGGGLWHAGGGTILNATFADNRAEGGPGLFSAAFGGGTQVTFRNTVFSGNVTREPYNPQACWFNPTPGSNVFQWPRKRFGGQIDDTPCSAGVTWSDPRLGALGDHGGPTLTLLPAGDSPLRGAGSDCPPTDQRGRPRSAARCTVGAVEP